jgi:hypothetical protein
MDDTKIKGARRFYLTIIFNDGSSQSKLYKPLIKIDKESQQYPNAPKYIQALIAAGNVQLFDGKTIDDIKNVRISYRANKTIGGIGLLFLEDSEEFKISDDGTHLLNSKLIEERLESHCHIDHDFLRKLLDEYLIIHRLTSIKTIALSIERDLLLGENVEDLIDKFVFTILRRRNEDDLPEEDSYRDDYNKYRKYYLVMKKYDLDQIRKREQEITKEEIARKAPKVYSRKN